MYNVYMMHRQYINLYVASMDIMICHVILIGIITVAFTTEWHLAFVLRCFLELLKCYFFNASILLIL